MSIGLSRKIPLTALACLVLVLGQLGPARAQGPTAARGAVPRPASSLPPLLAPGQREILANALAALEAGRREEARRLGERAGHPLASKLLAWIDLLSPRPGAAFEDIAAFLDANPDWPDRETLMRRAEAALYDRSDDTVVLAWFALRRPLSADGAMRHAEALMRAGERDQAIALVRETWATGAFGEKQEKIFLARYRQHLGRDEHERRLDHLIWEGRREEARRMLPLVPPGTRALADARLRLVALAGGIDAAIQRVPAQLLDDPGLIFERLRWRRRKGQDEGARELLRAAPADLRRPDIWWTERAILARRSIAAGRMSDAYSVVRDHRLTGGPGFAEAEFQAGWIALRFLGDAAGSLSHFARLHAAARTPVTLARGAYWAGRAADAGGDRRQAQEWYARAASHGIAYYGQIALARLDDESRPAAPASPRPSPTERAEFADKELARAARLLQELGAHDRVKPFILGLVALADSPTQHALAADFALVLDRPDLAVSAAKRSAQSAGVMLPLEGWPLIRLPAANSVEPPLVLATIRQESAFEPDAISRAGARGLMQLMPATAREVANGLGLPADRIDHRLLADPHYNLRLGQTYLARLLEEFGGSYVLAIAAYNAGPGRVRQWMRDHGDPRLPRVDVIDWIELIPYDETRNYVQRVLENLQVYRQHMSGPGLGRGLEQDLLHRRP